MYRSRHSESEFTDRQRDSAPWEGSPALLTAAAWSAAGAGHQRETQMPDPQYHPSKIYWLKERCQRRIRKLFLCPLHPSVPMLVFNEMIKKWWLPCGRWQSYLCLSLSAGVVWSRKLWLEAGWAGLLECKCTKIWNLTGFTMSARSGNVILLWCFGL